MRSFVSRFQERYPDGCPYSNVDTHARDWKARCIGFSTERLLHLWAVGTGVHLTYAVDDESARYRANCATRPVSCSV